MAILCIQGIQRGKIMSHSHSTHSAVTLSLRVAPDIRDQLEELSDATGRTKSFLAAEAIEYYLTTQEWQIKGIKKAVTKADSKEAKFVSHQKVVDWLNSWGDKEERNPPK